MRTPSKGVVTSEVEEWEDGRGGRWLGVGSRAGSRTRDLNLAAESRMTNLDKIVIRTRVTHHDSGSADHDLIMIRDMMAAAARKSNLAFVCPADSFLRHLLTVLSSLDTMAKSSSNKRKQASQPASAHPHKKPAAVVSAAAPASTPADNDDDTLLAGLLYPDELEASIDVLRTLAANPELMKIGSTKSLNGGQVKAFKSAMWDCWRAMGEVSGTGAFDLPPVPSSLAPKLIP